VATRLSGLVRRFDVRLAIVAALGLGGRLAFLWSERPVRFPTDEYWFVVEARRLFSSRAFTDPIFGYPTALHGPLGAIAFAPVAWLFPHAWSGLRVESALLGAAAIVACGLAARGLGGDRVGLLAAGVAVLAPDLVMASGLVGDDVLAAVLFAGVVAVAYSALERWTWRRGLVLGALLGLLTLCFTGTVELAGALLVGLAWHHRGRGGSAARLHGVATSLLAAGTLLVVLTPWVAFNYHRFHGSLVVTTELGQTLNQANNQGTYFQGPSFGYQTVLPPAVTATPAQAASEPTMDRLERDSALRYARAHWSRLAYVLPLRALWEWSLWRPGLVAQRERLMGFAAWTGDVQAAGTWLLLALGLAGLVVLRRRRTPIWPLVTLLVLATANGVAFTPSYRYRLGGIIALVIAAAVALDQAGRSRRARTH
jgi:MYXO-CTERM domain-containing protein